MKFTAICAATTLLMGCAAQSPSSVTAINPRVESMKEGAERLLSPPAKTLENSPAAFSDASWIPLRKVERAERREGNARIDNLQVEINQNFTSLNDVASGITSLTGLPVLIEIDTNAPVALSNSTTTSPTAAPTPPIGTIFPAFGSAASPAPAGQLNAASPFAANYSGSIAGFMNMVSAYYGVSWKSEASGLRFFSMESRTFRIAALPGDTRLNSTVEAASNAAAGGNAGSATQSGASTNSTGVKFEGLSVWAAIESSIKQMLSKNGRVVASPATGTITVTDTPSVMRTVSEFVKEQNLSLNRQVSVNVRVLSVELKDSDNYGINWNAVYANLTAISNPYSIALKTAFPTVTGAGNLVLSAPTTSASRWAGSSALISALSSQGRVSELTSSTLVTLNNQPAPVNVGRRVSYLASSATTIAATAGATTTLTPGTVQTGFSMTLVPHIIDNRELLLQYSIDISSLLALNTISSNGSTIQTPDVSTSNFIQRVRLKTGDTLVVAGFDQNNLSAVADGIGSPQNVALGSRSGKTNRTMLVILIQPNLVP